MARTRWLLLAGLVMTGCPVEYTVPLDSDGGTGSDEDAGESDDSDCEDAHIDCDENCVDPQSDPLHCGDCNNDCGPGGSCVDAECFDACDNTCDAIAEVCVSGTCECRPGFDRCGGTCVDLDINALHCGECGEVCIEDDPDEEFEVYLCQAGNCIEMEYGCDGALSMCGQSCVDQQTHPLHCGVCNRACDGDQVCIDGECLDS